MLIYLSPELHKRCIPQFHYALNPGGFLILGPAESVGLYDALFKLVDKKNKIYTKEAATAPRPLEFIPQRGLELAQFGPKQGWPPYNFRCRPFENGGSHHPQHLPPAAVVVDDKMQVHQFRGRTDLYLEHAPGPASFNLIQLARANLVPDLRATIRGSIKTDKPARTEQAEGYTPGKKLRNKYSGCTIQSPRDGQVVFSGDF